MKSTALLPLPRPRHTDVNESSGRALLASFHACSETADPIVTHIRWPLTRGVAVLRHNPKQKGTENHIFLSFPISSPLICNKINCTTGIWPDWTMYLCNSILCPQEQPTTCSPGEKEKYPSASSCKHKHLFPHLFPWFTSRLKFQVALPLIFICN